MAAMEFNPMTAMQTVTITVRVPLMFRARLWLGAQVLKVAALVLGCNIVVETSRDESDEVGA